MDEGFEFAFDNEAFSDKVLRIEVYGSSDDAPGSDADAASHKRPREEAQGDDGEGINSSCTVTGTRILRVNTIQVNSAILAAKSPFFYKLFSNGMKESYRRQVTLRIADSEENGFMEVMRFMYSQELIPTTDPTLLIDTMVAADKFDVVSCMRLCDHRLTGPTINITITRKQCSSLLSGSMRFGPYDCVGQRFFVSARCDMEPSNCFGLFIEMIGGQVRRTMGYEFKSMDYRLIGKRRWYARYEISVSRYKGTCTTDCMDAVGCKDLFGVPWSEFIAKGSPFFRNNILKLDVVVKINPLQP